jgi:hypothetical protein
MREFQGIAFRHAKMNEIFGIHGLLVWKMDLAVVFVFIGSLSGSLKPGKPESGSPGPEGQVVNR